MALAAGQFTVEKLMLDGAEIVRVYLGSELKFQGSPAQAEEFLATWDALSSDNSASVPWSVDDMAFAYEFFGLEDSTGKNPSLTPSSPVSPELDPSGFGKGLGSGSNSHLDSEAYWTLTLPNNWRSSAQSKSFLYCFRVRIHGNYDYIFRDQAAGSRMENQLKTFGNPSIHGGYLANAHNRYTGEWCIALLTWDSSTNTARARQRRLGTSQYDGGTLQVETPVDLSAEIDLGRASVDLAWVAGFDHVLTQAEEDALFELDETSRIIPTGANPRTWAEMSGRPHYDGEVTFFEANNQDVVNTITIDEGISSEHMIALLCASNYQITAVYDSAGNTYAEALYDPAQDLDAAIWHATTRLPLSAGDTITFETAEVYNRKSVSVVKIANAGDVDAIAQRPVQWTTVGWAEAVTTEPVCLLGIAGPSATNTIDEPPMKGNSKRIRRFTNQRSEMFFYSNEPVAGTIQAGEDTSTFNNRGCVWVGFKAADATKAKTWTELST